MQRTPHHRRLCPSRVLRHVAVLSFALGVVPAPADPAPVVVAAPLLVRFAPERDYGPFVYAEADGQIRGLSVDLLTALAPRAGLQIQTLPARDLADILAGVKAGEVDLVSSLRPNPERSRFLGFSTPYVEVPAVLVLRKGESSRKGLADLSQRRVGVGKAYAVEAFVRQRFPDVHWEPQPNDAVALRALAMGQLDGVVADAASVTFVQQREHLAGIEVHEAVGFQYALSFAYPIGRSDLGAALARGLRALPRAERDRIVRQWMDLDALSYRPAQVAWVQRGLWGLALLGVMLGVALLLRRRIATKAGHD